MQLAVRKNGDVTVITVSGTITMLDTASPLKERVISLVRDGERKFVLSLGQLTFVDSSCMGELVSCYVRVARAGGAKASIARERANAMSRFTKSP